MWKDKLKKVQDISSKFSVSCTKPGAPMEVIKPWLTRVQEITGVMPPNELTDVLLHTNGFEWNGHILYGVDRDSFPTPPEYSVYGLIEQNEIWYEVEEQKAYLFLGEGSISWYVYEIATGRYLELDNPSGREVGAFSSFSELFEKLLDDSLQ